LPDNMKFYDPTGTGSFDNDPPGSVTGIQPSWSAPLAGGPWTAGYPPSGQAGPLYLRWSVDIVGPNESGYMCYSASIL